MECSGVWLNNLGLGFGEAGAITILLGILSIVEGCERVEVEATKCAVVEWWVNWSKGHIVFLWPTRSQLQHSWSTFL